MLYYLTIALISFIIFLAIHVSVFHFFPPKRRFRSIILTVLLALVFYGVLALILSNSGFKHMLKEAIPGVFVEFANTTFLYLFLCYFYFHLIIVFDSSVTTRIMVEIEKSKEKKLTLEELENKYSLEKKFEGELEDMQYLDRLKKEDSRFANTEKGSQHAKIISSLRNFLHIGGHQ